MCVYGSSNIKNTSDVILCPHYFKADNSVIIIDVYLVIVDVLLLTGTVFLEFWKREQAAIQFRWNLMNFEEEEVRLHHVQGFTWSKYIFISY